MLAPSYLHFDKIMFYRTTMLQFVTGDDYWDEGSQT